MAVDEKYIRPGTSYWRSSVAKSSLKDFFSTVLKDTISLHIYLVTASVHAVHLTLSFLYFVHLATAPQIELSGGGPTAASSIFTASLLWCSFRCVCKFEVLPPAAATFLLQSLHIASFGFSGSRFAFGLNPKCFQIGAFALNFKNKVNRHNLPVNSHSATASGSARILGAPILYRAEQKCGLFYAFLFS